MNTNYSTGLIDAFLHDFGCSVLIETRHRNNQTKYLITVNDICNDKLCNHVNKYHIIATALGSDLGKTLKKCFFKVIDMQGEAPECLEEYRQHLNSVK